MIFALKPAHTLRLMTYNIHSCIGTDGLLSPERIAKVIAHFRPDIVALQEVDVSRARTGKVDQAHRIAQLLAMDFHFNAALQIEEEQYGDAILSTFPMRLVKTGALPGLPGWPNLEQRGALWVGIEVNGTELQVFNTHLGLVPKERRVQIQALLGSNWINHARCQDPIVFCGDLNTLSASWVCRRLREHLKEAATHAIYKHLRGTFPSRFPTLRIDHVFVSRQLCVNSAHVPATEPVRLASDHLPLIVDIQLPLS